MLLKQQCVMSTSWSQVSQNMQSLLEKEPNLVASEESECVMTDAEKVMANFLVKSGIIAEPKMRPGRDRDRLQQRRQKHYRNVDSLLKQYRSLVRIHEVYKNELLSQLCSDTDFKVSDINSENLYTTLVEHLELMSVANEKGFESIYYPQLLAGRRIEAALHALDVGLKALKAVNEEEWALIRWVYIDGEQPPFTRDTIDKMGYSGVSVYYSRLEHAKRDLTKTIFGFASNKAELLSILVYLRQQKDDEDFPL